MSMHRIECPSCEQAIEIEQPEEKAAATPARNEGLDETMGVLMVRFAAVLFFLGIGACIIGGLQLANHTEQWRVLLGLGGAMVAGSSTLGILGQLIRIRETLEKRK